MDSAKSITTNSLTAIRDEANEKLVYWTRIGHHVPLSWAQQKLTVAEENLQGFVPDAALVRISTQGLDEAAGDAHDRPIHEGDDRGRPSTAQAGTRRLVGYARGQILKGRK